MTPDNKYYDSQWRRDASGMPGAYLTEGGVHFVAALRMAARAAGERIVALLQHSIEACPQEAPKQGLLR